MTYELVQKLLNSLPNLNSYSAKLELKSNLSEIFPITYKFIRGSSQ